MKWRVQPSLFRKLDSPINELLGNDGLILCALFHLFILKEWAKISHRLTTCIGKIASNSNYLSFYSTKMTCRRWHVCSSSLKILLNHLMNTTKSHTVKNLRRKLPKPHKKTTVKSAKYIIKSIEDVVNYDGTNIRLIREFYTLMCPRVICCCGVLPASHVVFNWWSFRKFLRDSCGTCLAAESVHRERKRIMMNDELRYGKHFRKVSNYAIFGGCNFVACWYVTVLINNWTSIYDAIAESCIFISTRCVHNVYIFLMYVNFQFAVKE